jgi:hypothetical protein
MTRSERLNAEGKTDTVIYGVVKLVTIEQIRADELVYIGSDYDYNVDLYEYADGTVVGIHS